MKDILISCFGFLDFKTEGKAPSAEKKEDMDDGSSKGTNSK